MSSSFFTTADMSHLNAVHHMARKQMRANQLEPYVKEAVTHYASIIRAKKPQILERLRADMMTMTVPSSSEKRQFWAAVFEWYSYDFSKLHMGGNTIQRAPGQAGLTYNELVADISHMYIDDMTSMSMWILYRHTDFCARLLKELQLDPKHFQFKNLGEQLVGASRKFRMENELDTITEYINTMNLVYIP
jgi:hypothetical protein